MSLLRPQLALFCCLLILSLPLTLSAATHSVTVGNNFFSPNDLTIKVGDTVRWTNNAGRMHDVVADDGSFASDQAASFTYERTFNSVDEILYHCSIHSQAGRDIATNMNGRITVEEDDPVGGIPFNPGLNDTWFNADTVGQGFFITVFPDIGKVFLAWFTYDTERPPEDVTAILGEPGHRWITAFGDFADGIAVLNIEITEGGVFNSAEPAPSQSPGGTITVWFIDCENGVVVFDIPELGLMGEIPITRIALDNVPICQGFIEP